MIIGEFCYFTTDVAMIYKISFFFLVISVVYSSIHKNYHSNSDNSNHIINVNKIQVCCRFEVFILIVSFFQLYNNKQVKNTIDNITVS